MRAIAAQSQRAPDGAPVHYERPRSEQATLYRLVQQHSATFFAQAEAEAEAEAEACADLPQFIKDEFDAFLGFGILAHGLPLAQAMRDSPLTRQIEELIGSLATARASAR